MTGKGLMVGLAILALGTASADMASAAGSGNGSSPPFKGGKMMQSGEQYGGSGAYGTTQRNRNQTTEQKQIQQRLRDPPLHGNQAPQDRQWRQTEQGQSGEQIQQQKW